MSLLSSLRRHFPAQHFARRNTAFLISVALFLLAAGTFSIAPSSAQSPPRKILTGWIPYYSMKTSLPSAIANGDLIKEVMPFWFTLKSETKILDLYTPANPSTPMSIPLAAMRDSGFLIIPTITDGTAKLVLAKLIADPKMRTKIVSTITNFVLTNNFDGIDLDFEGFAFSDGTSSWPATQVNWVAFINELSLSLHSFDKLLSVTTPVLFDPASGKKGYYVYDWASISPMIDRLRIMTYDYSTSSPGPIGPTSWADLAVQYAVSVIPASKVYVGIAGYGRDWVTKVVGICPSNVASAVSTSSRAATFLMKDAANLAASYGATPVYSTAYGEVTFSYTKVYSGTASSGLATTCTASRTAWYQDARGYAARAQLVVKYHLGGITAWTLGMEDPTATAAVRLVAQSIAPDAVVSELSSDISTALYGDPVLVTGRLLLPDKTPVAGVTVHVLLLPTGETQWREVLQTVTSSDGTISVPIILSKTSALRITTDASWERLASQSADLPIAIKRLLSFWSPASALVGSTIAISGTIQPHEAGVSMTLERRIAGRWRTIGNPILTLEDGTFAFTTTESARGIAQYRVKVADNPNVDGTTSSIFSLVIY
ncbi:MAG: glycosyl hydrolase family 18 protein [Candidatus Nanopelagicaceae bacterium]|nr:glycosyl hydrolase family 18 protein [Candidatus Nanopelagicaceae bacterium]